MNAKPPIPRIQTGVPNLDVIIGGGLPKYSITVISGPPGSGKTILAQQIAFHNASPTSRVLYFSTLSESAAKVLRYVTPFSFFAADKIDAGIQFVDLGSVLLAEGLQAAADLLMAHVKRVNPTLVVIDSFKAFDDFAESKEALRKFSYSLAVNLMAWETTLLLLGEYDDAEMRSNPLFSVIDGQILLYQRSPYDEELRMLRVVKMRGTGHSRDEHQFVITTNGIALFAPRITIQREARKASALDRLKTGVSKLDDLLGAGIPRGSSLLVSGVAGTGKTIFLLDFIYRGAQAGEKGILFSFEETTERLHAAAMAFGWDLDAYVASGMIEVHFIPQPEIMVEAGLVMMEQRVRALQAQRVAIDSISVFLHKIRDAQVAREKVFQLASIVQNAQAVGFFATDISYGSGAISRFGVEETVVDGVILLTSTEEGLARQRYVEIYKLRNTDHLKGRHSLVIGPRGAEVYPRYSQDVSPSMPPAAVESERMPIGSSRLDELLDGGLLRRSATLVSGSTGIGKTTLGLQFLNAGLALHEPALFISLEEGPEQILRTAEALGFPFEKATRTGLLELSYLSPEAVRSSQFVSILADKIKAQKTRRLVLDGADRLVNMRVPQDERQELFIVLISQFKLLGVTTLLTLEADDLYRSEMIAYRDFSTIADNLLVLRYEQAPGGLEPYLMIVKTRGSLHDRGTYSFTVGHGGLRIGERALLSRGADSAPSSG